MEWMEGRALSEVAVMGGRMRACGGRSIKSNKLVLLNEAGRAKTGSNCLHSIGASLIVLQDIILGDPIGDKRRGVIVGELPGVNRNSVSESEWWWSAADSAGEGGAECIGVVVGVVFALLAMEAAAAARTLLAVFWFLRSRRLLGEVWIRTCRVNSSDREKRFSHPGNVHWWGFSPVWVRMWRVWCSSR